MVVRLMKGVKDFAYNESVIRKIAEEYRLKYSFHTAGVSLKGTNLSIMDNETEINKNPYSGFLDKIFFWDYLKTEKVRKKLTEFKGNKDMTFGEFLKSAENLRKFKKEARSLGVEARDYTTVEFIDETGYPATAATVMPGRIEYDPDYKNKEKLVEELAKNLFERDENPQTD